MHLWWMPQPKACHSVCPLYLLMTLLCSSASAPPFTPTFFSASNSHMCTSSLFYIFLTLYISISSSDFFNLQLCSLYTSLTCCFLTLITLPLMSPILFCAYHHLCLSPSLFCLLSEGTARAPVGHLAVVKAAQTVTWSAWSRGPGAAQTQTAPTAPSGRPSLRLAVSLASPSLPEGIALEATKAHREAARALALVRTVDKRRDI